MKIHVWCPYRYAHCMVILMVVLAVRPAWGQGTDAGKAEIEAIRKCSFLVGEFHGGAWRLDDAGKQQTLRQTEIAKLKLDGVVLQVEAVSQEPTGKILHLGLVIFSFDPKSMEYKFRGYDNHGGFLETQADCDGSTLSFHWVAGERRNRYTIRINKKGQWHEVAESSTDGGATWQTFFEAILDKKR